MLDGVRPCPSTIPPPFPSTNLPSESSPVTGMHERVKLSIRQPSIRQLVRTGALPVIRRIARRMHKPLTAVSPRDRRQPPHRPPGDADPCHDLLAYHILQHAQAPG